MFAALVLMSVPLSGVRWFVLMLVTACSNTGPSGTGVLAYIENGTGNIRTLDLASGRQRLIDPGSFATVSIAADHQYLAYSGFDQIMKVSDLSGDVTPLPPGATGCLGAGVWGPGDSLSFCVGKSTECGTEFVPSVGGQPRLLAGYSVATSADGSLVIYEQQLEPCGPSITFDVVVENVDGSGHRVLAAGLTNPGPIVITPDQQHVVTYGGSGTVMFSIADGTSTDLGTGGLCYLSGPGGERAQFSPDGEQLLICDGPRLVSVDLVTAARQTLVEVGAGEWVGPAAFVDATHITYTHTIDATPGSDTPQYTSSVHLLSDSNDLQLIGPETSAGWGCYAISASPRGEFLVTSCFGLQVFSLDGQSLARSDAISVLGYTPDTNNLITLGLDGEVSLLTPRGDVRLLATVHGGTIDGASYVP